MLFNCAMFFDAEYTLNLLVIAGERELSTYAIDWIIHRGCFEMTFGYEPLSPSNTRV
jgi:hypothetical protein